MKIYNNTPDTAGYNVNWEDGGDCGQIDPGDTIANPSWNGMNIQVRMRALPDQPGGGISPFSITIPQTKPGMAVTIGMYHE